MHTKGMGRHDRRGAAGVRRPASARLLVTMMAACAILAAFAWASPASAESGNPPPVIDKTGVANTLFEARPITAANLSNPADSTSGPVLPGAGGVCNAEPLTLVADLGALLGEGGSGGEGGSVGSPANPDKDSGIDNSDVALPGAGNAGGEQAARVRTDGDDDEDDEGDDVDDEKCCDVEAYLDLICGKGPDDVFWASVDDYNAGLLTIRYKLTNTGAEDLFDLRVTGATATKGVTAAGPLPMALGDLPATEWLKFTLKWQLPKNVSNFVTDITICADCEPDEPVCEGDDCDPEEPVCEGDECDPEEPVCEGAECDPEEPLCPSGDCTPVEPLCEGGCNPGGVTGSGGVSPAATDPGFHASSLPNTGFDLLTAMLAGLGVLTPMGVLLTVTAHRIPVRRR